MIKWKTHSCYQCLLLKPLFTCAKLLLSNAEYYKISFPGTTMSRWQRQIEESCLKGYAQLYCVNTWTLCYFLPMLYSSGLFSQANIVPVFAYLFFIWTQIRYCDRKANGLISAKFSFQRWLLLNQNMTLIHYWELLWNKFLEGLNWQRQQHGGYCACFFSCF